MRYAEGRCGQTGSARTGLRRRPLRQKGVPSRRGAWTGGDFRVELPTVTNKEHLTNKCALLGNQGFWGVSPRPADTRPRVRTSKGPRNLADL